MHISEYIKWKRQSLGYTQQQFADNLGVCKQAVSKWERGGALPDILTIPPLAGLLQISPHLLMDFIWSDNADNNLSHFIQIMLNEADGESYVISVYESEDFTPIMRKYEDIIGGRDQALFDTLSEYLEYDKKRTITAFLSEKECNDDLPSISVTIEKKELNPLINEYNSRLRAETALWMFHNITGVRHLYGSRCNSVDAELMENEKFIDEVIDLACEVLEAESCEIISRFHTKRASKAEAVAWRKLRHPRVSKKLSKYSGLYRKLESNID